MSLPAGVPLRGRIPVFRLRDLFIMQEGYCYYCTRESWHHEFETIESFAGRHKIGTADVRKFRLATREHLIKRQDGGTNQAFNVVMACAWCNSNRGDRSVLAHVKFCRQHFRAKK